MATAPRWRRAPFWANESCHIFHAAALSLKTEGARRGNCFNLFVYGGDRGDGRAALAALLGTYGRHLSPFAAIGLNDFIN